MVNALVKLPVKFKRYSFLSKCRYCSFESAKLFKRYMETRVVFDGTDPYPWELSVLTMLAMLDGEYQNNEFTKKDALRLVSILRENQYYGCNVENVDLFFAHDIAAVQIKYQVDPFLLWERYVYFFTFVNPRLNMPNEMRRRIGISSAVVVETLLFVICAATCGRSFERVFEEFVHDAGTQPTKEFIDLLELLSLPRGEYSRKQREEIEIANNTGRGCVTARNLLEKYPFVVEGDITYLPNVYLGISALSVRMLSRITAGDNDFRSLVGKEVIESYVVEIIQKTNMYDSVRSEMSYKSEGKESLSPDVCIEHNGRVLFLETKLCQLNHNLRNLNRADHIAFIKRHVEYLSRFIKHIKERDKYLLKHYSEEDTYGLLVLYEDSFMFRFEIFEELKKYIKSEASEFEWVLSHIHIVGLYEIERFAYGRMDMFASLEEWKKDEKKRDDYFIPSGKGFRFEYSNFKKLLGKPAGAFAHLFVPNGARMCC